MTAKEITVVIIWVAVFVLIGWDIIVATNGKPGDTISEIMLAQAIKHPIIPFALGVCLGHLFWPQFK